MRSARNNIDRSEVGASAIRSLRRKFVIMTMIALVITLAALDAAIYAIFSQSISTESMASASAFSSSPEYNVTA